MRQCAFCNRDANSGEHIWSDWIGRLFTSRHYSFRHGYTEESPVRSWQAPTISVKAKVVCTDCNNTWMSDIESNARDTLAGIIRHGRQVS